MQLFRAADGKGDEEEENEEDEEEEPHASRSSSKSSNNTEGGPRAVHPRSFRRGRVRVFAPVRASATEVRVILPALNNFQEKSANNNTNNNYSSVAGVSRPPSATMFAKN